MTAMQLPMTPARRTALAIGLPVCLALTGFAGLNFVAQIGQGSFPVSYAIADSTGKVSVNLSAGDVRLGQAAGHPAELTGTARYSLVRPSFTERTTADGLAFVYNCNSFVGNCGLDATVSVPTGTTASVSTGGGNATVTGTTGAITVSSGGGDVTANGVAGDISLNTDGGNIAGSAITAARVNAGTGGGDIEIVFTKVPRYVHVNTDGGNVTIVVPPGSTQYDVTEHTDGGNATASVPIDTTSPNQIIATSGGGDITITEAS
jgi:Putative adhesin